MMVNESKEVMVVQSTELMQSDRERMVSAGVDRFRSGVLRWLAKVDPGKIANYRDIDGRDHPFFPAALCDALAARLCLDYEVSNRIRLPTSGYEECVDGDRSWRRFSWLVDQTIRVKTPDGEHLRTVTTSALSCSDEWCGKNDLPNPRKAPEHSVLAKAAARARRNGIRTLAGLNALSWDEIEAAGGDRRKAEQISSDKVSELEQEG